MKTLYRLFIVAMLLNIASQARHRRGIPPPIFPKSKCIQCDYKETDIKFEWTKKKI